MMLLVTWTSSIDMVEGTEGGRMKSKMRVELERRRERRNGNEERSEGRRERSGRGEEREGVGGEREGEGGE